MRVLIAEADPALASLVRKGLEAQHYAVDVTCDGAQARAMAAYSRFHGSRSAQVVDGDAIDFRAR